MPSASQIYPDHKYPHIKVVVNDNTEVEETVNSDAGSLRCLYVFSSPKGPDGKMTTINQGTKQFLETFGIGPFNLYGQPLLNAYTAINSGYVTAHCLRVAAANAQYARLTILAQYRVANEGEVDLDSGEESPTSTVMDIRLVARINPDIELTDLDMLSDEVSVQDSALINGFKEVKLFSVNYIGRCKEGNNFKFRITSDTASDRENAYKNYLFEVFCAENGTNKKKEEFSISFNENAKYSGVSLFSDAVVNHYESGSQRIQLTTYTEGFEELFNAYKEAFPNSNVTFETFDPLLGIDKDNPKLGIEGLRINLNPKDTITLSDLSGIALQGGSDGDLDASKPAAERTKTLNALYKAAFEGSIDPYIMSKNKFPTTFIYDANFDIPTKQALAVCASKRFDGVAILDCGLGIKTKTAVKDYIFTNLDPYVLEYDHDIEAYCGKVIDPYSGRTVTVTGTCIMGMNYPGHIMNTGNGYKHIPMAGDSYGVLSGYVPNSLYPVYDADIDSEIMDELADMRVNYVAMNAEQQVIRMTQTTRQKRISNLSELNNVLVLFDVKRDCERICTKFGFNFSEASDITRFNRVAEDTLSFYKDQMVRSIKAEYSKNEWEAKRNIVHMNVEMVHKDLVKHFIIEIDVNRSTE